ncbi:hypothetical protein KP509_04G076900 [Ceratopteris richardii]|nr:hypothetical protein KP509_04G076900 [Ceratopteris richardii]
MRAPQRSERETQGSASQYPHKKIIDEVYGYIKSYEDGTIERPPFPGGYSPACPDFLNGIASKDVVIDVRTRLWARLFLPECVASSQRRAPIVLHFHGGGLCTGSAAAASFHRFCSTMAILSESIWVSVDYRLAPEYRLPAAYDDGFTAFTWLCAQSDIHASPVPRSVVASMAHQEEESQNPSYGHDNNWHVPVGEQDGNMNNMQVASDAWLCSYGDFSNCFLSGESSGGAIVHYLTMKLCRMEYSSIKIRGLILIHGAFLVEGCYDMTVLNPRFERNPDTYRWLCLPMGAPGDHPLVNPLHSEAPSFQGISWPPSFVAVADRDRFYDSTLRYVEVMKQYGHVAEFDVTNGEPHCFYLFRPRSEEAKSFYKRIASFIVRHSQRWCGNSLL